MLNLNTRLPFGSKSGERNFDKVFSVNPKDSNVFEGIEFSTDARQRETRTKLRLMLSKDGNSMEYRSDDILRMGRCR